MFSVHYLVDSGQKLIDLGFFQMNRTIFLNKIINFLFYILKNVEKVIVQLKSQKSNFLQMKLGKILEI